MITIESYGLNKQRMNQILIALHLFCRRYVPRTVVVTDFIYLREDKKMVWSKKIAVKLATEMKELENGTPMMCM